MAYSKHLGIDIPTDKQMWKQWSLEQHIKGLERKAKAYFEDGTLPYARLALEVMKELHKLKKFYDQQIVQHNGPVAFVTQFENKRAWQEAAREHASGIKSLDVSADMATDTGKKREIQQSGTDDSDGS